MVFPSVQMYREPKRLGGIFRGGSKEVKKYKLNEIILKAGPLLTPT